MVLSKPFRLPPLPTDWSARAAARLGKAGRVEPIVGPLNSGVSVAGSERLLENPVSRRGRERAFLASAAASRPETGKPGNGAALA